jgi:hypothetical protein
MDLVTGAMGEILGLLKEEYKLHTGVRGES